MWHPEEYAKLLAYDRDTGDQPPGAFHCHTQDGTICAGWLGYHDPYDLLAVRLGVLQGSLDPSCYDYTTDVPLWATGAEAAKHGLAEVAEPGPDAVEIMTKVLRRREIEENHEGC